MVLNRTIAVTLETTVICHNTVNLIKWTVSAVLTQTNLFGFEAKLITVTFERFCKYDIMWQNTVLSGIKRKCKKLRDCMTAWNTFSFTSTDSDFMLWMIVEVNSSFWSGVCRGPNCATTGTSSWCTDDTEKLFIRLVLQNKSYFMETLKN